MFAVFAGFALAAAIPPALAVSRFDTVAPFCERTWTYWCSMLLGAASFVIVGAGCSTVVSSVQRRASGPALLAATICLPVCDCAIASLGQPLARMSRRLAACIVTLGTCCNPPALLVTWLTLGPRLTIARLLCGLIAAGATAWVWQRQYARGSAPSPSHGECGELCGDDAPPSFCERFVSAAGRGMFLFALAAIPASLLIASGIGRAFGHSWTAAIILGAVLSPCSSSDALFARALFVESPCQLAFVVAAQCMDLRQMLFLGRTFGVARTLGAFAASSLALMLCSFFV